MLSRGSSVPSLVERKNVSRTKKTKEVETFKKSMSLETAEYAGYCKIHRWVEAINVEKRTKYVGYCSVCKRRCVKVIKL